MSDQPLNEVHKLIHDARKPLNRITMHSEIVKMVLSGDLPNEKGLEALDKIITAAKDCSASLSDIDQYVNECQ